MASNTPRNPRKAPALPVVQWTGHNYRTHVVLAALLATVDRYRGMLGAVLRTATPDMLVPLADVVRGGALDRAAHYWTHYKPGMDQSRGLANPRFATVATPGPVADMALATWQAYAARVADVRTVATDAAHVATLDALHAAAVDMAQHVAAYNTAHAAHVAASKAAKPAAPVVPVAPAASA